MNRVDFQRLRAELSTIAGMNQRYHQAIASKWGRRELIAKALAAFAAIGSAALAILTVYIKDSWLDGASVGISAVAATAALALNVFPFGAWELRHQDLFRRWTDLREDVDGLSYRLKEGEPPEEWLAARLGELEAKSQRLNGSEPLADAALLNRCQDAEEESRGCEPLQAA